MEARFIFWGHYFILRAKVQVEVFTARIKCMRAGGTDFCNSAPLFSLDRNTSAHLAGEAKYLHEGETDIVCT